MDMRLQHTALTAESPCGVCRSHFNVEGDVTIPGSLRETTHVLHASAMAMVEKAESLQDRVSVGGRVVFCVLYTQGDRKKIESIEATADYTHLCDMPGAVPKAEVFAAVQAEHVDAFVQNGRMTMRAELQMCARALSCERLEVLSGIGIPDVQLRTSQLKLRRNAARGSADTLLREEFALPSELSIHETLGAWAMAHFHDTAGGQGRIGLSGEVILEAIHAADLPGKPLVVTRHSIPVSQSVEISGEAGELLDGRIEIKDVAVASQDAGDGERTLRAEVLLGLNAWADVEENAAVMTDAYTVKGDDLRLSGSSITLRTGDHRLHAAESGKATVLLPEGAKPVRTMLAAFAVPVLKSFTQQGNRLVTEGVLNANLLYMTDEEAVPVSARVETPFRAAFAASAAPEDIILLTAGNVEAVPITSDRVELRYILHAQVEGVEAETVTVAMDAAMVPAPEATNDIVLCFAQPGEETWDIARRYRIPEGELRSLNPALNGDPKSGQGLVVWRRNVM